MRSDGSIKSLTTGLATVDKSRHGKRQFMKDCVNFRNDQIDGLSRRAPTELINSELTWTSPQNILYRLSNFTMDQDVLKPFEIEGDRYWMYSRYDSADMAVFDSEGEAVYLDLQATNYLKSAMGNDDIRMASSGNSVYVVNNKVEVETLEGSGPVYVNYSMLSVLTAPKVYSTLVVKWENPDFTQSTVTYEVGEFHPEQPIPDINDVDNGVNTIAGNLASRIRDQIVVDGNASDLEIDNEGATIVFRNVTTGNTAREFSNVTIEDGSGGAFQAINGNVQGLEELPRFSHPGALIEVRPDAASNRGRFYMRATSVLEAEVPNPLPTPDVTLTSEVYAGFDGTVYSGFSDIWNPYGTAAPLFPLTSYPNQELIALDVFTDWPIISSNASTLRVITKAPIGQVLPTDAVQFVEIWDDTAAVPVRICQAFVYRTVYESDNGNGNAFTTFEGTINGAIVMTDGREYKAYFSDQVNNFSAVPEVRWVEDSAPGEDTQLNPATMPHILYRNKTGTFQFGSFNSVSTLAAPSLARRTSGDNISNPMPAFVGYTIKDVANFQSRLALLTNDKVSMSVTNQPNDWFRGTVTALLATSPISIKSTSTAASTLSHFVEHNNDLMVFSPTGQFRFDGRLPLTPTNASLQQASSYPAQTLAVPVSAGNDVFFSTTYGNSAGLSQFSLDPQIDNLSVSSPMADLQIGLMAGNIQQIIATPNLGLVIVRMDGDKSNMFALEFEPQIDILKPIEPSWSKWSFDWGMEIISMRSAGDFIEFMAKGASDDLPRLYRMSMFGNRNVADDVGEAYGDTHLEARQRQDDVHWYVYPPEYYPEDEADLIIVQGTGCPDPGAIIGWERVSNTIVLDQTMNGGSVWYGYPYSSSVTLPDLDSRDSSGVIQSRASLRVTDYDVVLTGHLDAEVILKKGTDYPTQEYRGNPDGVGSIGYARDKFRVQYKQDSENAELILKTDSHVALDIHQVEWRGTYNKVGRRF